MDEVSRRAALVAGAAAAAGLAAGAGGRAQAQSSGERSYSPAPLPYDTLTINGLSDALLSSHHMNNYGGAVRRLGSIQDEIAALTPGDTPGFMWNGLKRAELMTLNSVILHEVYFASIGPEGSPREPGADLGAQIETDFGSYDSWLAEFEAMGLALGGGSGWVLLTWSPRMGRLTNAWAADHTMTVADGAVLMALDMYEHAYAIDYGANTRGYVSAFLNTISWENANETFASMRG